MNDHIKYLAHKALQDSDSDSIQPGQVYELAKELLAQAALAESQANTIEQLELVIRGLEDEILHLRDISESSRF